MKSRSYAGSSHSRTAAHPPAANRDQRLRARANAFGHLPGKDSQALDRPCGAVAIGRQLRVTQSGSLIMSNE